MMLDIENQIFGWFSCFFEYISGCNLYKIQMASAFSLPKIFENNICTLKFTSKNAKFLELVSKELNHLAAILHVYAGGLNFMK